MKKALTKKTELHHYKNGVRIKGAKKNMSGNCGELSGDCSGLRGECSGLSGECSELRGKCSELWGDCSGLSGNLDDCEITEEERAKGINIQDLVI